MRVYIGRYPGKKATKKNPNATRKVSVRIDKQDTWGMYDNLALIIHPMLIQLKNNKHGSPSCMPAFDEQSDSQYPQLCFDFYTESDNKANDIGHAQWNEIVDKMIWSFEQILDPDRDDKFHSGKIDFRSVPIYDSSGKIMHYELVRGPNDTSKFDAAGHREYYKRIQEGLDLFGKHFLSLWD
jgi:hypothetical protein